MKYLIQSGASLSFPDRKNRTPLHSAAQAGKLDAVKYLLGYGADVTLGDIDGKTPVDLARESGNENVVRYLEFHFGAPSSQPRPRPRHHSEPIGSAL